MNAQKFHLSVNTYMSNRIYVQLKRYEGWLMQIVNTTLIINKYKLKTLKFKIICITWLFSKKCSVFIPYLCQCPSKWRMKKSKAIYFVKYCVLIWLRWSTLMTGKKLFNTVAYLTYSQNEHSFFSIFHIIFSLFYITVRQIYIRNIAWFYIKWLWNIMI